jgi:hypothetical protein
MRDSVWTDVRFLAPSNESRLAVTSIKPYSRAYFDLLAQLPELRGAFALGPRVLVVGRGRVIWTRDDGVSELSAAALAALVNAW